MRVGLVVLLAVLITRPAVGRLDILMVAQSKLVPLNYLNIVQPAESGILKDIPVTDGRAMRVGQVLMHMDAVLSEADHAR